MINVLFDAGQRSNKLFIDAHSLTAALKYHQDIRFWTDPNFADEYSCELSDIKAEFMQEKTWRIQLRSFWWKVLSRLGIQQNNEKLVKAISQGKDVYICNWLFRMHQDFPVYHREIRQFFFPKVGRIAEIDRKVEDLRSRYDCLIAVHIRHGDYKTWAGGAYYYSFDKYFEWMQQSKSLFYDKRCAFVVFSNDEIPQWFVNSGLQVEISHGSPIEDHYFMGKCDYIISTISTFAAWAEYIGQVPRAVMKSESEEIMREKFIIEPQR